MSAGTDNATFFWKIPRGPEWVEEYRNSGKHLSRHLVLEQLTNIEWRTLVELGCHEGVMLRRIKETFPGTQVSGIDVSPQAVKSARDDWGLDVTETTLMTWLPSVARKSYDVVLTHYALAYVSPDDLPGVISQCLRVASKAIILAEPTGPGKTLNSCVAFTSIGERINFPEWQHDYPRVFAKFGVDVESIPVEPPVQALNWLTVVKL